MMKILLEKVTELMKPYPVYAVGGCVRDYIIGNIPKDYDFCTSATPEQIEECVKRAGRRPFLVGKKFGTIGCKIPIEDRFEQVEITTFRTETYKESNRKPEVAFVDDINQDLNRRDFTINAIAARIDAGRLRIIDPVHGQEDIKNKILKCVGNSKLRFKEDPLRILRAIRFASRFDLKYEEKTAKRMKDMAVHLLDISRERWMMEFDAILMSKNPSRGIRDCFDFDIFRWTIPELSLQKRYNQNSEYHDYNLDEHTIKVIEATPEDINLRWAALLHDIAKPFVRIDKIKLENVPCGESGFKSNYPNHEILGAEMVKRIALHLKWDKERTEKVINLVLHHLEDNCLLRQYDQQSKKVKGGIKDK